METLSLCWPKNVLKAAALYNLVWGAWVVLFPFASFDFLEMPRPNYPQFWQCVGIIVGVYGVGYYLAANVRYATGRWCLWGYSAKYWGR